MKNWNRKVPFFGCPTRETEDDDDLYDAKAEVKKKKKRRGMYNEGGCEDHKGPVAVDHSSDAL